MRGIVTLGAVAVGAVAAALLPMAVAFADTYDFTPAVPTFVASQVEGFPPLIREVTGAEKWSVEDLTTNTVKFADIFDGKDTVTTIGSFTNDDYLATSAFIDSNGTTTFIVPSGTEIDLANFGSGFGNEWMDIPVGSDAGISDLLITPFGDFELFGTGFAELAAATL
jgi:hypothetical protein